MAGRAEVDIDAALVRRLVANQFPQWADLEVRPVAWARAQGWTLWKSLIIAAGLAATTPRQTQLWIEALKTVLADENP